ncbi:MAG: hypothetical protein Q7T96_08930 [Methylobacter sp.]|nr:hypothetical protein [Methylobacter sp.]
MPRKIHMQDQVGRSKVAEIMSHDYGQSFLDQWTMKCAVIGLFLLVGVYW